MTTKASITIEGFIFYIEVDYNNLPTVVLSISQLEYLLHHPETLNAIHSWLSRHSIVIRDICTIAHHDVFTERRPDGVLGIVWLHYIAENHQDKAVRELAYECIADAHASQARKEKLNADLAVNARVTKKQGYVYLAYSDTGHHKIGISKGPEDRIKVFDTKMPVSVSIVHSFPADNARKAEEKLHARFSSKHHNGEWFLLEDNDVSYICSIRAYESGKFKI